MVYNKVNAVDAVGEYAKLKGISKAEADIELKNYGILELISTEIEKSGNTKTTKHLYDLSKEVKSALQSGKNLVEYLQEKHDKEQQDQQTKNLQYQDFQFKVDKLNQEQLKSLAAQRQRNIQLTLLGILTVLISGIALLKSFGFFD